MPSETAEQIIKLDERLRTTKSNLDPVFDDIRTYILPQSDAIYRPVSSGQQTGPRSRYDSTAVESNMLLASSMQGALTPVTSQWFDLQLREDELNENKAVQEWLEVCAKRMHKAYQASNFGVVFHQAYLDLGGYGTTAVFQQELPRTPEGEFAGLSFEIFPLGEYVFTEGHDGRVNGVYRRFQLSAVQAFEKFSNMPRFNGLGERVTKALESEDQTKQHQKFTFLHVIRNRIDRGRRRQGNPLEMPIESLYIAVDDKHVVHEGGYQEMPAAVARWVKLSDDDGWGRGPGWVALPEAKTLSEIKKLGLKGLVKDISPPLLVPHKGVIGGMKTSPNALNYWNAARTNGAKPEYLTSGNRWDIAQFKEEDLKAQIRGIFMVDQLQLRDSPQMTATEAQIRFELMQRMLGPTFWRLVNELFNPTIFRTFQIMLRAGAFPEVPGILREMATRGRQPTLDVQYVGPLAKAQKQSEIVAIERTYTLGAAIAQAKGDPSVLDNLDDDEALRMAAEQLGAPGKIVRDIEQVAAMRDAKAQAQAQAAQVEQANVGAQAVDRLASANQKLAEAGR